MPANSGIDGMNSSDAMISSENAFVPSGRRVLSRPTAVSVSRLPIESCSAPP